MQSLTIVPPNSAQPLHLAGKITIPLDLASLPTQGALQGNADRLSGKAGVAGHALATAAGRVDGERKGDDRPLAVLPWEVAPQRLSIKQGEWRWPYSGQPLNGGLNIALHDWSKGWDETEISARLNVITAGHNGKGNAVLTLGPGKVGLTDSDLRFQLTGGPIWPISPPPRRSRA